MLRVYMVPLTLAVITLRGLTYCIHQQVCTCLRVLLWLGQMIMRECKFYNLDGLSPVWVLMG